VPLFELRRKCGALEDVCADPVGNLKRRLAGEEAEEDTGEDEEGGCQAEAEAEADFWRIRDRVSSWR
jgi:hypothetical protein